MKKLEKEARFGIEIAIAIGIEVLILIISILDTDSDGDSDSEEKLRSFIGGKEKIYNINFLKPET